MTSDTPEALVFDQELLDQVMAFCKTIYYQAFSPEEAEAWLKKLSLVDAISLWKEAGPEPAARARKPPPVVPKE